MANQRAEAAALQDRIADIAPDVSRGQRAQQLLENELLVGAFRGVREKLQADLLKAAPMAAKPEVARHIETIGHELAAVDAVESMIQEHINTGKIRGKEMAEAQDRLAWLKRAFSPRAA